MRSLRLKPILGTKSTVPQNDESLFSSVGNNVFSCYCVDGVNFDTNRTKNASTKSYGYQKWSSSATAQHTRCSGLFELKGSSTTDRIFFDNGKMYVYDAARAPQVIELDGGAITMADEDLKPYSMMQVGNYIVWTDWGEHTPYAWDNGDLTFDKLISGGTEYKFRYLEYFQNYIMGAYSDQTNGDIEIRWSGVLPTPLSSCEFAAGSQLYKPGNDSITGIKKFSSNSCFLYGSDTISVIDYYPNYMTPFAIRTQVPGQGSTNHHSIVDTGGRHFLFNKNHGFCEYRGGVEFPYGGRPISYDIEDKVSSIDPTYYALIYGVFFPKTNEVAWAVPLNGSTQNNHILYYNIITGSWRIENKPAWCLDNWTVFSNLIWDGVSLDLADISITLWSDFGYSSMSNLISQDTSFVFANNDGNLYYIGSEENYIILNFDGYRIEPIVNLSGNGDKSFLQEIWFDITEYGPFEIDVSIRGANTVTECENSAWTKVGGIRCTDQTNTVVYPNVEDSYKYHQVKWGTPYSNQRFGVNGIELRYEPEGRY